MAEFRRWYRGFQYTPHRHSLPYCQHTYQSGTCVEIDEPTMIHHDHPKSVVSLTIHSWSFFFCGFGHSIRTCIHCYNTIQSSLALLKILCALPILPSPQILHLLIFVLSCFPFSRISYGWNSKYVALLYWLISLSNMHLRLHHVFSLLDQFTSVQSLSCVQLFATLCTPGLPIHHQLPEST